MTNFLTDQLSLLFLTHTTAYPSLVFPLTLPFCTLRSEIILTTKHSGKTHFFFPSKFLMPHRLGWLWRSLPTLYCLFCVNKTLFHKQSYFINWWFYIAALHENHKAQHKGNFLSSVDSLSRDSTYAKEYGQNKTELARKNTIIYFP